MKQSFMIVIYTRFARQSLLYRDFSYTHHIVTKKYVFVKIKRKKSDRCIPKADSDLLCNAGINKAFVCHIIENIAGFFM